jgi:ectoine hydroxylase-related dioxygenase (phytanoyl-CoA dioxygenase family)
MKAISNQAPQSVALSDEEIADYHRDGVIGPFTLCSPDEMEGYREKIEREVIGQPPQWKYQGANADSPCHYRHLDCPVIHELCSHPAIVERLAALYGPDLLLWRTSVLLKAPGSAEGKRFPWHQDGTYFKLVPEANISFWLAIDPATEENGCVQLLAGSHTTLFPTTDSDSDDFLGSMSKLDGLDTSGAVKMILRPGQFFIFSERTLHSSEPNRSNSTRKCLVGRVVPTFVKIDRPFERAEGVTLLCGEDRMGFNQVVNPPG